MRYFVDIDGTICTQEKDYRMAEPYYDSIAIINRLYDSGHEVIYWSARGGTTGKDWTYITEKQLKYWGCKYSSLRIGDKPDFDILIDDRSRRINEI